MNHKLCTTYRTVAIARLIFISASFILAKMYKDSLPKTGLFPNGIDIHFDWWVAPLIILIYCAYALVVVFQLLVCFAPQIAQNILQRKVLVRMVLIIEVLAAGFIGYLAADHIQRYFFPKPRTILDTLFSPLFPTNAATIEIGKYQAVNYILMALCSVFFAALIWKYRKNYLSAAEADMKDAANE